MSDRKRVSTVAVSPQKASRGKRRKDEKENVKETEDLTKTTKQGKTKYKFAPTNSLGNSTPLKTIKIDPNVPKDQRVTTPLKPKQQTVVRNENPSSDDYVFWASTPKLKTNINPAQSSDSKKLLPSSPLEEIGAPINPASILPQKFHSIKFDNFSAQRSPEGFRKGPLPQKSESFPSYDSLKRTSSTKPKNFLNPFSLSSTPITTPSIRKKDITNLINTVESAFTSNSSVLQPITKQMSDLVTDDTPSKLKEPLVSLQDDSHKVDTDDSQGSSEFLDDDFSEGFLNDLDNVLKRTATQPAITALDTVEANDSNPDLHYVIRKLSQTKTIRDEMEEEGEGDENSDMDDSDFDDDLIDKLLDRKSTQVRTTQNVYPSLNTQERDIRRVDREGHLIFKKDIEDTDLQRSTEFRKSDENLAICAFEREGVHRFEVKAVLNSHYTKDNLKKDQKILTVRDSKNQTRRVVIRGLWTKLDIEPMDVINIIGDDAKLVDDDSDNLLIWNPDLLLSATLIGDTVNCDRRSVLKSRLTFRGDYSKPLIVGEIVHAIFQAVLKDRDCSIEFMNSVLELELDSQNLTILTIQESKETIREDVRGHIPYIKTWYETYVKEKPLESSSIRISSRQEKTRFATSNILDIEENIWSPIYGLRGLIDVTIEAYLQGSQKDGKFIAPLELKSGARAQISHKAQASLYTLLMKDRYDMDVGFYMLVYTKLKETTKYEINKREMKDLIMVRNQVSKYLKEGERSLPPLKQQSVCDNCFALAECMTYNKLSENGISEESGLQDGVYDGLTEHLNNEEHSKFFNYWDDLITKEEATINLLKKSLFLIDSETREKTSGKCLAHLIIKDTADNEMEENHDSFIYTFVRKAENFPPLNVSQLAMHDRILVSDESGHFALCSGWVKSIRPDEIKISTNRRLKNHNLRIDGFNIENNQTYQTFLKPLGPTQHINDTVTYRIDKDDMFHGMKLARFNILNLFLKDGDSRRRELIVEGRSPTFSSKPLDYTLDDDHSFNTDQIRAFDKVLSANDYALLLGMPGTGKTTVIAQLIRFLVQNKKTVLLTSYTHSAVDNILIKIKDDGIGVVRLGHVARVHPDVQKFSPYKYDIKTSTDLSKVFLEPPVVATTCLGISEWIFNRRRFDYCIVDESSQVSMPVCVGPLGLADKFILVGDHYQLPPLVQNPDAKAGLSRSLFKILSESFPEAVVDLSHQYRMCSDIMLLSNTIIYEGRLKCGSEAVANQSLHVPYKEKLESETIEGLPTEDNWLASLLAEDRKVIFLNHDNVSGCTETSVKENIENPKEALLIYQIVEAMVLCGVSEESIGVMSFYRAQLRLFYRIFAERKKIEMLTADQFQGRDKDCVIISLVKSNERNDAGSLLKEWRRVNVAITRAKSKLIIVGSKKTLQTLKTIDAFMKILSSRGWFYDLPKDADSFYSFKPTIKMTNTPTTVRTLTESRVLKGHPLTKEIAEEIGL